MQLLLVLLTRLLLASGPVDVCLIAMLLGEEVSADSSMLTIITLQSCRQSGTGGGALPPESRGPLQGSSDFKVQCRAATGWCRCIRVSHVQLMPLWAWACVSQQAASLSDPHTNYACRL